MLTEEQKNHLNSLEFELTTIGTIRLKVDKILKEKLPRPIYLELAPEIDGHLQFIQSSLFKRAQRLKEIRY